MKTVEFDIVDLVIHWKNEYDSKIHADIKEWAYYKAIECGLEPQSHYYAYDEDYRNDLFVEFDVKINEIK